MIEVKGIDRVRREIAYLRKLLTQGDKNMMEKVGKFGLDIIKARTEAGKDRYGRGFIPNKDGSPSTLKNTGKLMGDLHVQASAEIARIYVGTQVRGRITNFNLMLVHARGLKAGRGKGYSMPMRDPMGFTQTEIGKIRDYCRRLIVDKIAKLH
jgi:phage gpG-like protein